MKKVRKGKKMLLTLIIVAIVVIVAILIITKIAKKNPENSKPEENQEQLFELPNTTTDSGMDVQKVSLEYRKEYDETVVTMRIINTTSQKVNAENFKAILIGQDDDVLGSMPTGTNKDLEVGEECEVTIALSGDLTATQRIKLDKID